MNKKYKLRLDLKLELGFTTLYRIERLSNGELGGYIEKESNLSQDNEAWVYGNARVYSNAQVSGNAQVFSNAQVFGDAQVFGNARVSGNAQVYGDALVYGDARVSGNAQVYGNARVSSPNHIANFIIGGNFSITITPDNIAIGCQLKKRKEWLKVTKEEAVNMGLPAEYFDLYRKYIKLGMKTVPHRSKIK